MMEKKLRIVKKNYLYFIAIAGLIAAFIGCEKEESTYKDPEITFIPNQNSSEQQKGVEVAFVVNLYAEAGLKSLDVTKNETVFTSDTYSGDENNSLNDFSYIVESSFNEGDNIVFNFKLTDQANEIVEQNYTITVAEDPIITKTITDMNSAGTGTVTWTKDTIYILDGFVYVNNGQTLTIEAGTIIKGKPGQAENASALVVARGGKIIADGTKDKPIIFTSTNDPLRWKNNELVNQTELDPTLSAQWGGLLILGNALLNTVPAEQQMEGIPLSETRGLFGGSNDSDNSGILRYISIRHGGSLIGADNEINGVSLGGVGNGTTIEYIEVFGNLDDGFEFWGGDATYKYLLSAYNKDDSYDYDTGFRGKGQFWCAIQDPAEGDELGELDGADNPEDGTPYATPEIYNATLIGAGDNGSAVLKMRRNAGGFWYNSIFVNQKKGIEIEFNADKTETTYDRLLDGDLDVDFNMFYNITAGNTANDIYYIALKGNYTANDSVTVNDYLYNTYVPGLTNQYDVDPAIDRNNTVPGINVDFGALKTYPAWSDNVTFKGAFDPNGVNWTEGWTLYDAAKKAGLL